MIITNKIYNRLSKRILAGEFLSSEEARAELPLPPAGDDDKHQEGLSDVELFRVQSECSMLKQKLEENQAENQKLNKKLDEARDEISCKDIAIRRMKKDADRKAAAMVADTSEVKEEFARDLFSSAAGFVKDVNTDINDSQTYKCMQMLTHMTDDCFGKHEPIHRELKDMIQGIFGSREQVAKEQNEPRVNNVRVEKGGVYNAEVHHQDIHPKVDKRDSLPEEDMKDSLPRHKRRRLGLEGEDYEWR